jgi:hypothetical protein
MPATDQVPLVPRRLSIGNEAPAAAALVMVPIPPPITTEDARALIAYAFLFVGFVFIFEIGLVEVDAYWCIVRDSSLSPEAFDDALRVFASAHTKDWRYRPVIRAILALGDACVNREQDTYRAYLPPAWNVAVDVCLPPQRNDLYEKVLKHEPAVSMLLRSLYLVVAICHVMLLFPCVLNMAAVVYAALKDMYVTVLHRRRAPPGTVVAGVAFFVITALILGCLVYWTVLLLRGTLDSLEEIVLCLDFWWKDATVSDVLNVIETIPVVGEAARFYTALGREMAALVLRIAGIN